jgi:hypothetical protein
MIGLRAEEACDSPRRILRLATKQSQIVQVRCDRRMIVTEHLFIDRQ